MSIANSAQTGQEALEHATEFVALVEKLLPTLSFTGVTL